MRRLYTAVLYLLLPLALARLLWRSLRLPEYRQRLGQRFGRLPADLPHGCLWIHAVSVGEVQAVERLVKTLLTQHPTIPLFITTTTPTGAARVRALFGDQVRQAYFPWDLPFALRRFLDQLQPRLLVIVETEIWPNLLHQCQQRDIPVLLANARLSARSARGYQKLGRFSRQVFGWLDQVAAQSAEDAGRFQTLGVPASRIQVTGSIKFDTQSPASNQERIDVIRRQWAGRPVWVSASTHEGEEELILAAHKRVLEKLPEALLVLAPRHPERFERVAGLIRRLHFRLSRRSDEHWNPRSEVFLLDSMGELPVYLGAGDVAFIGGSLVPVGGHNMLEAAAQGVPVLFGPHVFNFAAISALLIEAQAAHAIKDTGELADQISTLLSDASERSQLGENGRKAVANNQGAVQQLYVLIERMMQKNPA